MPNPDRIAAYLEHLQGLRRSPGTRAAAQRALAGFQRWCEQHQVQRLDELSPRHLEDYRQALSWMPASNGRLYAAHTVDLHLRMLRAFLRWALPGAGPLDPTRGLLLPRPKQRPLRLLSPAELERLLAGPNLASPGELRDRLLLELACEGLSLTASCRLDLADFSEAWLEVRSGHARQPHRLALSEEALQLLHRYLVEGRPLLRPQTPALLVSRRGQRLSMQNSWQRVKLWAREAGLARAPRAPELAASRQAQRQAFAERRFFLNRDP